MEIESIKMYKKDLLDDIQVNKVRGCKNIILPEKVSSMLKKLVLFTLSHPEVKAGDRQRDGRNTQL